jgi:putative ABC transport system permease protein
MNAFALALRNLVRQKRRSFLMIAVVTFGFAAFALAGGFVAQTFEALRDGTIRSIGHLQAVDARSIGRAEDTTLEYGIHDARRARAVAAADPDVAAVLPRIDFVGLATNGTRSVPFLGVGVDPEPEAKATLAPELLVSGKYLSGDGGDGVVLGTGLANALGVGVGGRITMLATTPDGSLNAVDGIVAGLADVKIKELNDRYLAAGVGLVSRLLQSEDTVSKLVVFLKPGADEKKAAVRLEAALRGAGFPLVIQRWQDLAVFYGQVRMLYVGIFGFVGTVLVVIVILSAAIVMTMAVTERTREIGTLRALGTRPSGIRRMFLAEGVALALVGCAAGALLAVAVRAILNVSGLTLPPPPGGTTGAPLNVKLYPLAYGIGFAAMVVTMTVASYFPARRASRLPIVDQARQAFGEAKITARATQIAGGKTVGTADFDIYVKGRDRALIVFRGGKNDGRKALTVGEKMWLIVPGAENPVPITKNQRLMGGASFGDVASMRFAEDYTAALRPGTEPLEGRPAYVLDLTANSPKAAYPKVTLWLDEQDKLPRKLLFFLPSGREAREVTFTKFRKVQDKPAVAEMEVVDRLGPSAGEVTRLEYLDIKSAKIDDKVFTPEGAKAM